ncbi:MAG: glycoside hydrolase family 65 [Paenibacillaceae bacterium]|jgi:hypothetical protein|nr:glycoside hydrolase family 65 [Paenibacillaceae bacterium]
MSAIDRRGLVTRHHPVLTRVEPDSPLTVGNGEFAFTVDYTGLQSFPQAYRVPLGTQSQWGWHSTGSKGKVKHDQLRLTVFDTYGRKVGYAFDDAGQQEDFHWLRQNPHRMQLVQIGFVLRTADGAQGGPEHGEPVFQTLNLWEGCLESQFLLEGIPTEVTTVCHPHRDCIAVRVSSPLMELGRLAVRIAYPSSRVVSDEWDQSVGLNWQGNGHHTHMQQPEASSAVWTRTMDDDSYEVRADWSHGSLVSESEHVYMLTPEPGSREWEFTVDFASSAGVTQRSSFTETTEAARRHWEAFWLAGGAADFSESTDSRAHELERRTILSQYVTAVHCSGSLPPQETGLMYNSWFGKFHLEMHWWHAAHFPLWDRTPLLARSMDWYRRILPKAQELAASQGYEGARWPKMIGPDGEQGPSSIATLLIWQQPHPIMLAELCYRSDPGEETLRQYAELVLESARFMASFAYWDDNSRRYVLGPPVIPAQECHRPEETVNPAFELEYWRYGLETAQLWRSRLGLQLDPLWEQVIRGLSALPVSDEGVYLAHEQCPDTYLRYNEDHPSMLGALGVLPGRLVDHAVMRRTLGKAVAEWKWDTAWGWDFPMAAMTASELHEPELALDLLLLEKSKNTYLPNGHNYQRPGLSAYLPGNGGLLSALAVICTGNSQQQEGKAGVLQAGAWTIRWEGLSPLHEKLVR